MIRGAVVGMIALVFDVLSFSCSCYSFLFLFVIRYMFHAKQA